jgi:uncharacterized protein
MVSAYPRLLTAPRQSFFLPIAALFHGQVLSTAALARDAGVSRTTIAGYLDVLEDTLMAFRLQAYEARLRVRERRHPKLYIFDPGVARALAGSTSSRPGREELGHLFEGWIATVLRAYRHYRGLFDHWGYWAPLDATTKVDFILRRGRSLVAIEAKFGEPRGRDLAGLKAVGELPGCVRRLVVCRVPRAQRTPEGIEVLPVERFLALLKADRLWP